MTQAAAAARAAAQRQQQDDFLGSFNGCMMLCLGFDPSNGVTLLEQTIAVLIAWFDCESNSQQMSAAGFEPMQVRQEVQGLLAAVQAAQQSTVEAAAYTAFVQAL
jgi:hypothetical protein